MSGACLTSNYPYFVDPLLMHPVNEGPEPENKVKCMTFRAASKALMFANRFIQYRKLRTKALDALPPESKLRSVSNGRVYVASLSQEDGKNNAIISKFVEPVLTSWTEQLEIWDRCRTISKQDEELIYDSMAMIDVISEKFEFGDSKSWHVLIAIDNNSRAESHNGPPILQAIGLCEIKEIKKQIKVHYLATAPHNLNLPSIKRKPTRFAGAATAAIHHLFQKAVFHGWNEIILDSLDGARPFYAGLGFEPVGSGTLGVTRYCLQIPNAQS